jgi:hypothetical protein
MGDQVITAGELASKQHDVVRRRREVFAANGNACEYAYWTGYENALADLRQILQFRKDCAVPAHP